MSSPQATIRRTATNTYVRSVIAQKNKIVL
jgi:hypothetical protein